MGGEDGEEEEALEEPEEEELKLEAKTLQLSFNSYKGLTLNKSFKVYGKIQDHPVKVLVDCGATNNFLSWEVARKL